MNLKTSFIRKKIECDKSVPFKNSDVSIELEYDHSECSECLEINQEKSLKRTRNSASNAMGDCTKHSHSCNREYGVIESK